MKLAIINDTPVIADTPGKSFNPGGTSSFISGIIPFFENYAEKLLLIGNFRLRAKSNTRVFSIIHPSNARFVISLFGFFITGKLEQGCILYFHRPDHVITSLFKRNKKVLHLHGCPRETILNNRPWLTRMIYLFTEYFAIRMSDLIIVTDRHSADVYKKVYKGSAAKMKVFPASFDSLHFFPVNKEKAKQEAGLDSRFRYVIYHGRLAYPKKINEIINVFAILEKSKPDLRLIIAGEGKDRLKAEELSDALNIREKVLFNGWVNKEELNILINCSEAGILLSGHEGSPVSVKECLACGIPVLVNDRGDLRDYIVPGKTGVITNSGSTEDIAGQLEKLLHESAGMKNDCIITAAKYASERSAGELARLLEI